MTVTLAKMASHQGTSPNNLTSNRSITASSPQHGVVANTTSARPTPSTVAFPLGLPSLDAIVEQGDAALTFLSTLIPSSMIPAFIADTPVRRKQGIILVGVGSAVAISLFLLYRRLSQPLPPPPNPLLELRASLLAECAAARPLVITGPSSAGKRTLVCILVSEFGLMKKVRSFTTRPPRANEVPIPYNTATTKTPSSSSTSTSSSSSSSSSSAATAALHHASPSSANSTNVGWPEHVHVDVSTFMAMAQRGEFAEFGCVSGVWYGTRLDDIQVRYPH